MSLFCFLWLFLPTSVCGAGGEPNHQLPSVSGAACRGREVGGPFRGNLRQSLPLGQRRRWAAEASWGSSWCGEPGSRRPPAARPPLCQLRRAYWTLWPGHGYDYERDRKHFHFHGWCWWVNTCVYLNCFNVFWLYHRGAEGIFVFMCMLSDLKSPRRVLKADTVRNGLNHEAEEFSNTVDSQGVMGNMSSKTTTEYSIWSQSASGRLWNLTGNTWPGDFLREQNV